jgi:hypothetical protein
LVDISAHDTGDFIAGSNATMPAVGGCHQDELLLLGIREGGQEAAEGMNEGATGEIRGRRARV